MKPLILTLIALFISLNGWAQTSTITYQGKLLDASASPVTNSSMPMTFAIYSAETGGTKLWPSGAAAAKTVDVDYGLYTVTLGTGSGTDEAFTSAVFAGGSAWLEVSVNGTTLARTRLTTVPFSYHAASLDGATWEEPGAIGATTPGTGKFTNLTVGAYSFPSADGSNGQVLTTNGSGAVNWETPAEAPVTSVAENGSTPLVISPTTGNVQISIGQANGTSDGYLSSTDWTTFNNKSSLALGETNATAYRGDRGKAAYDERGSQIGGTGLNWDGSELDVTWGTPGDIGTTTPAEGEFTKLSVSSYTFPQSDGTNGQVMLTNGSGNLSWGTTSGLNFDPASPGNIGYTTPAGASYTGVEIFTPSNPDPVPYPLVAKDYINTNLGWPVSVYVEGNYAYVAEQNLSRLCIYDISDPDNIIAKDYISTNLDGPKSVYVIGSYAYVSSSNNNRLCIYDISNPDNIIAKDYISTNLDFPLAVSVKGSYAYVASGSNDRLCIYDISNPDNIIAKDYISTNLDRPVSVYVSGSYAYVASTDNDRLCIYDISNPDNIIAKDYISTNLDGPSSVYVIGAYAYVVSFLNNRLCIYDISDPDNIIARDYISTNLDLPMAVSVKGSYAYVASGGNDRICIYDISNPDNIIDRGYTTSNLDAPIAVSVKDNYVYVVNNGNNYNLSIFEAADKGIVRINDGKIEANNLDLTWQANIQGGMIVDDFVNINSSATISGELVVDDLVNINSSATISSALVVGSPTGGNQGDGTINAQAVYDDNTLLTDYVFDWYFGGSVLECDMDKHADYRMLSLQEMIDFTRENRHLPTITGREEWEKYGKLPLGILTNQIWETVETQAIYIMQLKEENEKMKQENEKLKNEMNENIRKQNDKIEELNRKLNILINEDQ